MKNSFYLFVVILLICGNSQLKSQNNDVVEYSPCDSAFLDMIGEVVSNQYSCNIISEILELQIFQEYLESIDSSFPRARIVNLSGDFLSGICPCRLISIVNKTPIDLNTRKFADLVFYSLEEAKNYKKYVIFFNRFYDHLPHNVFRAEVELEKTDGNWQIVNHWAASVQTGNVYTR